MKTMIGKVTDWKMTPEELAAYKKKYPPKPENERVQRKKEAFSNIHTYGERMKKQGGKL